MKTSNDEAVKNCPTPAYHQTHRYCPSCPFVYEEPKSDLIEYRLLDASNGAKTLNKDRELMREASATIARLREIVALHEKHECYSKDDLDRAIRERHRG